MIYLDSCALVKLVRTEDGSSALQEWLDERCDELAVTSALSRAEVLQPSVATTTGRPAS